MKSLRFWLVNGKFVDLLDRDGILDSDPIDVARGVNKILNGSSNFVIGTAVTRGVIWINRVNVTHVEIVNS